MSKNSSSSNTGTNDRYGDYKTTSSGSDRHGNHTCTRDYGNSSQTHWSKNDGSYGYVNPDASVYHRSSDGTVPTLHPTETHTRKSTRLARVAFLQRSIHPSNPDGVLCFRTLYVKMCYVCPATIPPHSISRDTFYHLHQYQLSMRMTPGNCVARSESIDSEHTKR
ncbi:hypothetical protein DFJ77DRAFT_325843 [Powellomyces hirtus]|nr:hypothetical protein DFJ77DRAFT_325843 [Powellomyces hirtus]